MPGLSASQMTVILSLIEAAPDTAIRSLDMALANETSGGPMGEIRDLVSGEASERRARLLTFRPLAALCFGRESEIEHERFPAITLNALWRGLKAAQPELVSAALGASAAWMGEDGDSSIFDEICLKAAAGLRGGVSGPLGSVVVRLDAARPGCADILASYLDLAPLARRTLRRLPEWVGRMTEERAVNVRLAFRDAVEIAPDAGPRFFEILFAHLDEPWQILRIASAVMDHPSDGYMAASEIAGLGQRLLADIDRRLDDLRTFDPTAGAPAGRLAGEAARAAVLEIAEFDQSLELKRDGPWGQRIIKQKHQLAQAVEGRLKHVADAVDAALPLRPVKYGPRTVKGVPNLKDEPEAAAVAKAEGLLAFLESTRSSAATGGFTSARAKVVEALEARLDHYAEDLIEELRNLPDSPNHDRARSYLELTARFLGYVRDEKAAQLLRRRAAA